MEEDNLGVKDFASAHRALPQFRDTRLKTQDTRLYPMSGKLFYLDIVSNPPNSIDAPGNFTRAILFLLSGDETAQLHFTFVGLHFYGQALDIRILQKGGLNFGRHCRIIEVFAGALFGAVTRASRPQREEHDESKKQWGTSFDQHFHKQSLELIPVIRRDNLKERLAFTIRDLLFPDDGKGLMNGEFLPALLQRRGGRPVPQSTFTVGD